MNQSEYEQLRDEILSTFPELHEYGARYAKAQPGESGEARAHRIATANAQRERRRDALIGLEVCDVRAAINEYRLAPNVPWNEYGRQGQGFAMIGDRAKQIAKERRSANAEASEHETAVERGRRRDPGVSNGAALISASGLVAEFVAARKRGELLDAKAVREWFDQREPLTQAEADQRRNRYVCLACLDTGRIPVVAQLGRAKDGSLWWTTTSTACECESGCEFRQRDERCRLPVYDETRHVRVVRHATERDIIAEMS